MAQPTRCGWAGPEPIYLDYHDHEWGRPTHDDRALFELLSLEGMQAGLSWITILNNEVACVTRELIIFKLTFCARSDRNHFPDLGKMVPCFCSTIST